MDVCAQRALQKLESPVIRYKKRERDGKTIWYFDFRNIRHWPAPMIALNAGVKPKYTDPDLAKQKIEEYFRSCMGPLIDRKGEVVYGDDGKVVYVQVKPYTLTGLSRYMGLFTTNFKDYCSGKYDNPAEDNPENLFSTIFCRARQAVEEYAESRLYDRDGQRGAQYILSAKFDWATHKERLDDKNAEFRRWKEYKELELKYELLDGGEDSDVEIHIVRKTKDD
jgi:hypothetical protein